MSTSKVYTIGGKNYIFKLTLRQSEMLGPLMYELVRECPETFSSAENMAEGLRKKFEITNGGDKNEIFQDIKEEMVKAFQSIIKLKLRTWLQKKNYITEILAVVLVPEDGKFQVADVEIRKALFADSLDLDNDTDRAIVDEVIDYFFTRNGVLANATPIFSFPAMTATSSASSQSES